MMKPTRAPLVVLVLFACVQPTSADGPSGNDSSKHATAIMGAQLAAMKNGDESALMSTFGADAIVLVPDPRAAHSDTTGLLAAVARLSPHDVLSAVKLTKIAADGNASAIWWSAEYNVAAMNHEPQEPAHATNTTVRVTELATADSQWKVVAAAFAEIRKPEASADPSPIDAASTTAAGPLTPLAADVTKLDAALASHAAVFGTDKGENAYDVAAAHRLLHGWSKLALSIDGKPRELHGNGWGFAITNVDWQQLNKKVPARMSALVIGTPAGSGWQVVAVQYTPN